MRDQLLIGGSWLDGADGERITVSDPATGEPIAAVAAGTPADAVRAVDAADVAQRSCGAAAPRDRAEVLRRCWETLLAHRDELARLITAEHGKPLADALGEAGMVGVNRGAVSDPAAPFGGMKQSGLGHEGASEGILEFCETQYIAVDW